MIPQILHNNCVRFPKDILMHYSVHTWRQMQTITWFKIYLPRTPQKSFMALHNSFSWVRLHVSFSRHIRQPLSVHIWSHPPNPLVFVKGEQTITPGVLWLTNRVWFLIHIFGSSRYVMRFLIHIFSWYKFFELYDTCTRFLIHIFRIILRYVNELFNIYFPDTYILISRCLNNDSGIYFIYMMFCRNWRLLLYTVFIHYMEPRNGSQRLLA